MGTPKTPLVVLVRLIGMVLPESEKTEWLRVTVLLDRLLSEGSTLRCDRNAMLLCESASKGRKLMSRCTFSGNRKCPRSKLDMYEGIPASVTLNGITDITLDVPVLYRPLFM